MDKTIPDNHGERGSEKKHPEAESAGSGDNPVHGTDAGATAKPERAKQGVAGLRRLHDQGLGEMAYREFLRRPVRRRPPRHDGRPAVSRLRAGEIGSPANSNTPPDTSGPSNA